MAAVAAPATAPDAPAQLKVRTPLQHQQQPQQPYRSHSEPPASRSGSRFGQLSQSSFFARHNPHPQRCTHIQGLLGLWIPVVVDDAASRGYTRDSHRMPVNAININSQKFPIDTINGLQYFTNLRSVSLKEKAVPRLGLVPVTENWRDQLRRLTEQTFSPFAAVAADAGAAKAEGGATSGAGRQGTSTARQELYSRQTGRIIPPKSRQLTRRSQSRATPGLTAFEHISASPDLEAAVFSMLSQILQTEDYNSVQAWLVSASDRERALVMDIIRSAIGNRDAYYEMTQQGEIAPRSHSPINIREDLRLPPISERQDEEREKRVDRLVIEDVGEQQQQQQQQQQQPQQDSAPTPAAAAAGKQQKQKVGGDKLGKKKSVRSNRPNAGPKQQKQQGPRPAMKYSKAEPTLGAAGQNGVWKPMESVA